MSCSSAPAPRGACGGGFEASATRIASNVPVLHGGPGGAADAPVFGRILQANGQLPREQTVQTPARPGLRPCMLPGAPLTCTVAEYVHLTEGVSKQGKKDLLRTAWPCVYM